MARKIIVGLALYYLCAGVFILLAPIQFYKLTPGVSTMGPYNMHFIIDVGLIFIVSGAAMAWGALKNQGAVMVVGSGWPFLHGGFHLFIWFGRGVPFDLVALSDWSGVIAPGFLALSLSLRELKVTR